MSLVRKYQKSPNSYAKLLKAINSVGEKCDMDIIAEGVEDKEAVESLHELGISKFQSNYFGKPVPLSEFIKHTNTKSSKSN